MVARLVSLGVLVLTAVIVYQFVHAGSAGPQTLSRLSVDTGQFYGYLMGR